jgi:lipoate synthase
MGFGAVASGPMVRSSYKAGMLVDGKLKEQAQSGLIFPN